MSTTLYAYRTQLKKSGRWLAAAGWSEDLESVKRHAREAEERHAKPENQFLNFGEVEVVEAQSMTPMAALKKYKTYLSKIYGKDYVEREAIVWTAAEAEARGYGRAPMLMFEAGEYEWATDLTGKGLIELETPGVLVEPYHSYSLSFCKEW
jgi:hypothetical protein